VAPPSSAVTIFAGDVVTVDPDRPRAEALAVEGDTIATIGPRAELQAAFPEAPVEELRGTVVPGLIDSHLHLQWLGLKVLRLFGEGQDVEPDDALEALEADGGAPVWPGGEPTLDERVAGIELGQSVLHALGVTAVVDPALTPNELAGYQEAHRRGVLTMGVVAMPHVTLDEGADRTAARMNGVGVRTGFGDETLRLGGLKVYYDGQGRAGTALLREPWPGREQEGYTGERLVDPGEFARFAAFCARERWSLGVHVVGGGGIGEVLAAFATADRAAPIGALGFTLIHAYLEPTPDDMATARALGVLVAVQPSIQLVNGPGLLDRLGEERATRAMPLRSWRESGVTCGGGSDGPYFPTDPRLGLWQARTRRVRDAAEPVGPEEALDGDAALELYTAGAAAVALSSARRGRLAPGRRADFVALSVDPATCPPDDLLTAAAWLTVAGGRVVHSARGPAAESRPR
jgi:predicted amidohydrolase YtcJ